MKPSRLLVLLSLVIVGLLAACGTDENGNGDETPSTGNPAQASGGQGSGTLTVGDESWELESFRCAFGHEATRSDTYSFSSDSRAVHTNGNRMQIQVEIRDETGEGRFEGDGVIYQISADDITDFENPAVDLSSRNNPSLPQVDGKTKVTIDGDRVTAEGLFRDGGGPFDAEMVPGTFEGTCSSSQSIR